MILKDKVAFITGSGRGIGKEIALSFAKEGATVIISDINKDFVDATVDEFTKSGFKAAGYVCDVTNLDNVSEVVGAIIKEYKCIDILINNAGVTRDNLLLRMQEKDWDFVLNTNLKGTFVCTKVVSKYMLKARKGKVINIASIIGVVGNAGQANYAASKAGVIGFTKSIAKEFSSRNITANAVAPGFIQSEMTEKLTDKAKEEIFNKIPLGKLGTPKDIAGVCLFLASAKADYITGQTIVVDGGMAIY